MTTTLEVRSLPTEAVPGLAVTTTGISRVSSLEIKTEHIAAVPSLDSAQVPGLQVQSHGVTTVPSLLEVKSEGVTNVTPCLGNSIGAAKMEMPGLEVKTEAVSTSGLMATSPVERRSPDAGLGSPASNGAIATTAVSTAGVVGMTVTGSGSVTATPTAYTTAVTTTATTTTTSTGLEGPSPLLGKRIRKQSTKYEDYEQQTLTVSLSRVFPSVVFCIDLLRHNWLWFASHNLCNTESDSRVSGGLVTDHSLGHLAVPLSLLFQAHSSLKGGDS